MIIYQSKSLVMCLCRYTSRINLITFKGPAVGPQTKEEKAVYTEFTSALHSNTYSSCIGWVISLMDKLIIEESNDVLAPFVSVVEEVFHETPRLQQGWTVVLYFTMQVNIIFSSPVLSLMLEPTHLEFSLPCPILYCRMAILECMSHSTVCNIWGFRQARE